MSFLYLTALFLIFFALRTQTVRVAQKIKSRLVRYKKSDALRMVECCVKFPVFPIICLAMRKISCTLLCSMVVAVPDAKFPVRCCAAWLLLCQTQNFQRPLFVRSAEKELSPRVGLRHCFRCGNSAAIC